MLSLDIWPELIWLDPIWPEAVCAEAACPTASPAMRAAQAATCERFMSKVLLAFRAAAVGPVRPRFVPSAGSEVREPGARAVSRARRRGSARPIPAGPG